MDEEQRKRMAQADRAAGTMFNVFPQGVGERVSRGAQSLAGAAMGMVNRFTNPIGTLASDIGAARQAVSGTRLIGPTSAFQVPPTALTAVLPSGTPMTGFDSYPTIPQMAPRTEFATAPQPAAPSLAAPTPVPAFPTIGMGLMGNQNISPLPTDQISPMTRIGPTLADRGGVNVDIAGMRSNPQIQTPYGTIYATPEQAANMNSPRTVSQQSSRSPAEQQALLSQMQQRGSQIRERIGGQQEAFFAEKKQEREALRGAEAIARGQGARTMDIMRAREAATPTTLSGIQAQFSPYQAGPRPSFAMTAQSKFAKNIRSDQRRSGPMGLSGFDLYEQQQRDKMARGESGAFSNARSRQRRATRGIARSQGIAPATNYSSQLDQEEYFRRRNLA
jgi:hypothetical protein